MAIADIRGEWKTVCRSCRLLSKYIPHFFIWLLLHSTVMAAMPYLEIGLFAVLAETVQSGDAANVWITVLTTLAAVAVTRLSEAFLRRIKEAKWDMLYRAVDRLLTDKVLSMDQPDLEDPLVGEQLAAVREAATSLGIGIVRLPDIVQNVCRGTVGVVASVWVSFGLFGAPVSVSVIPLWFATLLLTVWIAQRASRPSMGDTRAIADADRAFYAFSEAAEDPLRAADMRIYRQDRTVLRYLERAETAFFAKEGLKYRRAHGASAAVRALCTACPWLWVGGCAAYLLAGVSAGTVGVGALMAAVGAWSMLPRELGLLVGGVREWSRSVPYMERLLSFLDRPPRLYRGSLTTEKRRDGAYELELRRVSFTYPSQTTAALSDVSLCIRSGSRTAIVGENGSGKSTLIKLLCRLYDPDEGEILLNGINIRKYRYEEYLDLMAVVFQDHGRLPEDPLRSEERKEDALWPRAIACALRKEAPFLLLDEPMAADPKEEARLYAAVDALSRCKTVVTVSHRPSGCRFCDTVIVMDKGRVAEQGSHEELLSRGGRYHAMWYAGADCDNDEQRRR